MKESFQKYAAEAIGTFIFIFCATAAALANWQTGGILGTVGVALASGFALTAMIYALWHVSGAHLNPAVTVALFATGHIRAASALGYIVAQLIGGAAAALLLKVIYSGVSAQFHLGATVLGSGVTPSMGILIEAVFTFFLVWTIFGAVVDKKATHPFGGLVVGFVLAIATMIGGHLTMASLNPARSFGPALISSHWEAHYVYWVGPIIGALAAALIYQYGFIKNSSK